MSADKVARLWAGAQQALAQGPRQQAIWCLEQIIQLDPAHREAHRRLAELLRADGDAERAAALYVRLLRSHPDDAQALTTLGELLEDLGEFEQAREVYTRATRQPGDQSFALGQLLALDRGQLPPEAIARAQALLDAGGSPRARALIAYGLGKLHDRRGEHAQALRCWEQANAARRAQCGPLDRQALAARVARTREAFSAAHYARQKGWMARPEQPIFIVGMPRSGTTLIEQVLSRHPQVRALGESPAMPAVADRMPALAASTLRWPEAVAELTQQAVYEGGKAYMQLSGAPAAQRWTDKAPLNIFHVGLIRTLFPHARVLLLLRDPRDVLLSIYEQNFALHQTFATDWEDLAFYYARFAELCAHWQAQGLIDAVLGYEGFVAAPRAGVDALLAGLHCYWAP